MINVFDDPDGEFVAVVNAENQHALWPTALDVPGGWTVVHGPDTRQNCLDHIENNWTDMRPASLVRESAGR
ncbi:MbtH family protein [Streptomyces sp. G45]|uniref:MbtH family protein n=1 Tax=Streptomyces sp. G45 TaxID=3406627 RepID=UPI003C1A9C26